MRNELCVLIIFLGLAPALCQTGYEEACKQLVSASFEEAFKHEDIESRYDEFLIELSSVNESELSSCNCADTVWIALLNDRRNFISYTHSLQLDTNSYLRELPTKIDVAHLQQEFKLSQLKTLKDSLELVLQRMALKDERRSYPANSWRNFYHCTEAETYFMRDNKYRLKDYYFRIIDDATRNEEIKMRVLSSFWGANSSVENAILSRIESYKNHRFFNIMLVILHTSGTERSIEPLIQMMQKNQFDTKTRNLILLVVYRILDRGKVRRKVRKGFEVFLGEHQLDTLSKYDIYNLK